MTPNEPCAPVDDGLVERRDPATLLEYIRHNAKWRHRDVRADLRMTLDQIHDWADEAIAAMPEIASLLAERDALGWRTIESAPKDGTVFLAFWPVEANIYTHRNGVRTTNWTGWGGGCWEADGLGRPVSQPTHWQPTPAPPVTAPPQSE